MRKECDFSASGRNPYAARLKRQITIRLDTASVDYFKEMAAELGMPCQNLINLFLRDCAMQKPRPVIAWPPQAPETPAARQNRYFTPNCIMRGGFSMEVTAPKLVELIF